MRVVLVEQVAPGARTWRITLSCGHVLERVTHSWNPNRGRPRCVVAPCFVCLDNRRKAPWTGPRDRDLRPGGRLRAPVPPERWPYGPPSHHEGCCHLHASGLYCDCLASDSSDDEHGTSP